MCSTAENSIRRDRSIDMETSNRYKEDAVLSRAVKALSTVGKDNWRKLPGLLRETACKGKPCEFQHNHLRIRYCTKDDLGQFKLHWLVSNGISGRQQYFYNKDWVGENGQIRWMSLAKAIRRV